MSKHKTEREFLESFTDEELDNKLNRSYQVGISVGLDQASNILMTKATCLFASGLDELASRYRDLARELKKLSDMAHPGAPK